MQLITVDIETESRKVDLGGKLTGEECKPSAVGSELAIRF